MAVRLEWSVITSLGKKPGVEDVLETLGRRPVREARAGSTGLRSTSAKKATRWYRPVSPCASSLRSASRFTWVTGPRASRPARSSGARTAMRSARP
jgi:hypothetical protein